MDENKKRLKSSIKKCENCGGNMIFSPQHCQLICENCKTKVEITPNDSPLVKHDLNAKIIDYATYNDWVKTSKIIKCDNCGAEHILDPYTYTSSCPFCGASSITETKSLPGLVPDLVVPFAIDKTQAFEKFKENVKKKFFVSSKFKKNMCIDNVMGTYIPSFLFDADTESDYKGVLCRTRGTGKDVTIETFPISGHKSMRHTNILTETSSKIQQKDLNDIEPYNIGKAKNFDESYIRGYIVEHFTESVADCYEKAKNTINANIRSAILKGYSYDSVSYLNIDTKFFNEKFAYVLLPVYRYNYTYNKKQRSTLQNGQTGKVGKGLPLSKIKIFFAVLLAIIIIGGIILLSTIESGVVE